MRLLLLKWQTPRVQLGYAYSFLLEFYMAPYGQVSFKYKYTYTTILFQMDQCTCQETKDRRVGTVEREEKTQ